MPLFRSPVDVRAELSAHGLVVEQALGLLAFQNAVTQVHAANAVERVGSSAFGNRAFFFDISGPSNCYYSEKRSDWGTAGDIDLSDNFNISCVLANDHMTLVGGHGLSGTNPLRYSVDEGDNWTAVALAGGDHTIDAFAYSPAHTLWMMATSISCFTAVGTGPTLTWEARATGPNNCRQIIIRDRPFRAIALAWSGMPGSGTSYKVSDDLGVSWTDHTAPFDTFTVVNGFYSDFHGAWFVNTATGLWRSYNGVDWTQVDSNSTTTLIGVVGGTIVRGDGYASPDGRYFTPVLALPSTMNQMCVNLYGSVIMSNSTTGDSAITPRLATIVW